VYVTEPELAVGRQDKSHRYFITPLAKCGKETLNVEIALHISICI